MALWLHEATHDSVAGQQFLGLCFCDHCGNDGVIRPLARSIDIGVIRWTGDEIGTAILQRKATSSWNDGCAKSGVIAVDERTCISLGISNRKIDCI